MKFILMLLCILCTPVAYAIDKASEESLKVEDPAKVIKLEVLDPNAMAYVVQHTWISAGHKFALVRKVTEIKVVQKGSGSEANAVLVGDMLIIKVPMILPEQGQVTFTGFIKVGANGVIATYHPVTGEVVPYKD